MWWWWWSGVGGASLSHVQQVEDPPPWDMGPEERHVPTALYQLDNTAMHRLGHTAHRTTEVELQ